MKISDSATYKGLYTILLLILSNLFMTFAWYGHLQFQKIDWLIALFEYIFQGSAYRIGHLQHGGPFTMFELKTIQEAISISVFLW